MIVVNGVIQSSIEDIQALTQVVATMEEASRAESGCVDYTFSVELSDPTVIRITEQWESLEALQAHFAMPHMADFQQAMAAHVTEHVAFQYRREMEKMLGVEMPDEDQPLPDDVEVEISRLAKDAAEKLLKKDQAEAAQQQAQAQQQDPVVQMQQQELQLKAQELQHKMQTDMAKLQLEAEKIKATNQREGAKLGVKLATDLDNSQRADQQAGAKLGVELAKELGKGDG